VGTVNLKFIKQRRQELKVSQEEMSDYLGFGGRSSYGPYELGNASFKAEHLPKLCQILKCSITELYKEGTPLRSRKERELLDAFQHIKELWEEETE